MAEFEYIGNELELFAKAEIWKAYFRSHLQQYVKGDVLEVGAGLGGTTTVFANGSWESWSCLEPDQQLLDQLKSKITGDRYRFVHGTLNELGGTQLFDAILYIDVLEHIERDADEVAHAAKHLKPGGKLIILSPAYQYLFSPFDAKIGHYRRYTRSMLKALTPPGCSVYRAFYLDSVGALASLANKLFLKASMPTAKQISFWNRVLVRCSKLADPLLFYSVGRSVIVVWQKASQ